MRKESFPRPQINLQTHALPFGHCAFLTIQNAGHVPADKLLLLIGQELGESRRVKANAENGRAAGDKAGSLFVSAHPERVSDSERFVNKDPALCCICVARSRRERIEFGGKLPNNTTMGRNTV